MMARAMAQIGMAVLFACCCWALIWGMAALEAVLG
jgi:hypothetical protein